jgi:CubicO group peptidase (beta-lactamase class C family)
MRAIRRLTTGRNNPRQEALVRVWPALASFYAERVRQAGIVGSGLVVVSDGRIVAEHHEGLQDLDARRPADRDTIYHWASITKTLTGIAVMQLRDRGRLRLDDPVVDYIPDLRQAHNPFGDMAQVTIRQLMSHSAGFRAPTWPWGGDRPWHPFEPTRWEQLVAMLPYTELLFKPGSRYRYSNPGVIFLGRIIEQLSGDDYETYVTKNILMPLGMHRSFFDRAPYHLVSHRSHSYFRTDEGLTEARFDFDTGITVSNGGLNAPLTDMARYLAFLIGDPSRAAEYDVVLRRATLEEMFVPQLPATDGEGGSGADVSIGLSFFIERHGGVELVGHSGSQNGFLSHLYLHRPSKTGYLVAFNTEVTSKQRGDLQVTRQVDADVRDRIAAALFAR